MSVSKKPAMSAYSNQKRAQRVRKVLDATAEALQRWGTMVLLLLGRNSQEVRMMMHSIELDTKPLSSLCSWLCFPPDSVLIVQKHFTSEHMFSHVTFGCVYFTWQTSLLRYWCLYSYFAFICLFVT